MKLENISWRVLPKFRFHDLSFVCGFAALLFLLSFSFYVYQIRGGEPCCDAVQYIEIAERINAHGLAAHSLRTWGYPWFLSIVYKVADALNFEKSFLVWFAQTAIYLFGSIFIYRVLSVRSNLVGRVVYALLCLNFFLIPYLGITLSDGLATTLIIIVYGFLIKFSFSEKNIVDPSLVFWVFLFSSFAVVVRPASIWIAAPVFFALFCLITVENFTKALVAMVFGLLPLFVQISLNASDLGLISFMPATDLGALQLKWGIENIKYATWLGGGPVQNFYSSRFLIEVGGQDLGIAWYLNNPLDACKLIVVKLIAGFDFDYLMPYPKSAPFFKWQYSFISLSVLYFGVVGVFARLVPVRPNFNSIDFALRFVPLVSFIAWSSVSLVSALELRFVLPIFSLFLINTPSVFIGIRSVNRVYVGCAVFFYGLFIVFSMPLLQLVRASAIVQN